MYDQIPAPKQTTECKKDLTRLDIEDSVQYKPFNGGNPKMLKVLSIHKHKTDEKMPRLFIGLKDGKEIRVFEHQVILVIFKSRAEYPDLVVAA